MKIKLISMLSLLLTQVFAAPVILQIESQQIQVKGKNVPFYTIRQLDGTWGYIGQQNHDFQVIVKNNLPESTVLHWHGLIVPNSQDGVSGVTQDSPIPAYGQQKYTFPLLQHGTYWMHAHHGMYEQLGVEAPLIIEQPSDKNIQQVVMMLQDFSFKSPESIFKGLTHNPDAHMHMDHGMDHSDMSDMKMDMANDEMNSHDMSHMDLNDVKYDAYLTNYRSPDKPQIQTVMAGKSVRLRFINGASSSNFWLNLGKLQGKIIAVDGQDVIPYSANKFPLAMGQRVDVVVNIPANGGTYPIIGQVEGLTNQTGLILTTHPTKNLTIAEDAAHPAPAVNNQLDMQLAPLHPVQGLSSKTKNLTLTLNGDMSNYTWTLNNQIWPHIKPLVVNKNETVNLTFDNQSMMSHPMHLHGYVFKVVRIDGKPTHGIIRDTVMVLPHSKVTVQFVADMQGKWMLHCHNAYHMSAGMMTYLQVK